ncbi:MAG: GAF domain-containing sensor histidine kinase [Scytonema sp. PMC 1069.18]|nr:GAF domain-containing sensor histidine kinase [Scytonema sp. PMC 1069.18]MEC4887530.1 GAF domain-containing sensor histidine kinase [Scytonema sp. PMC 1070.18]
MSSSPDLSFSRILPHRVFARLGELLHQIAQAVGKTALVLTEAVLVPINIPQEWQRKCFVVIVSKRFSALLVADLLDNEVEQEDKSQGTSTISFPESSQFQVNLTFNSEAIACFLSNLKDLFERDSQTYKKLEDYRRIPAPNDATLQSQFTLLLLEYFLPNQNQNVTEVSSIIPFVSICQPVEQALQKQRAQERLLNQVTTQIRKSLDLSVIIATAVTQVREFLKLDRLVVYKFEKLKTPTQKSILQTSQHQVFQEEETSGSIEENYNSNLFLQHIPSEDSTNQWFSYVWEQDISDMTGRIIYEVRASDSIPSVLVLQLENSFKETNRCWEKYRQGYTLAINDVEKTYVLEECLLNFLREANVRAKLASPIVFEDNLWGLLIAHQCTSPRQWTESEKILLTSVAEQLAIAIHQAELMQSLTHEKQTLEARVIERTVALHDALIAAETARRLRSEFLATVSHELLTPLTYVIGMSSTLLRWSFGELTKRQRDYLQTIHDSGEHLLEMINDILELSQIEAGKAALNVTQFSLRNIAETIINGLQDKAITQRINLKLDVQINQQGDRFPADVSKVQQILGNLLSNAIKFTPEGGNVILRLWIEDENAIFQVEDTGIGIPEEQLPLLFEKFHQLDTPYRRRYGGTGLGLALTKQLVELHRGRIEVESTVGVGSVFTVWIPAQPIPILKD